jgi:hypothetical protein
MHSPLARRPEAGGASPQVVPVSPARSTAAAEYLLPVGWRGISAQVAAALGMLTGLWVAISPWFIMLQYRGANATVTDVIAGAGVSRGGRRRAGQPARVSRIAVRQPAAGCLADHLPVRPG